MFWSHFSDIFNIRFFYFTEADASLPNLQNYNNGWRTAYYVGSSIGALVFFAIVVGICVCCMRQRRAYNQQMIRTAQPGVMVVNSATGRSWVLGGLTQS
jgi:hypothetical protein